MFYTTILFFICLVPGSKPLTFNGKDSHASLKLGNITKGKLSFDLQTRQKDSFILACYDSPNDVSRYFLVAIDDDGKLLVRANYSGNVLSLTDITVTDGKRHAITIETINNNSTSISGDGTTRNHPVNILNDDWLKLLTNNKLDIGTETVSDMYPNEYFGALTIKIIGNNVPEDNDFNLTNVDAGWNSNNPCQSNPCVKGQCIDIFNAYICDCDKFYTGTRCNETINVSCDFNTTICNHGTCINLTESTALPKQYSHHGKDYFKCNCSAGYLGNVCQQETDECTPNNCQNGAQCVDGHLSYTCDCVSGWEGRHCDQDVDDCASKPCQNKATCVDRFNDYECQCVQNRYEGKNCTEDVNECTTKTSPCSGHGNCTNTAGDYTCACNTGYYSNRCQYNSTEYCINASPCLNGGVCSAAGNDYHCACASGYIGKHCDSDFEECDVLKPCENNAVCSDSHNTNGTFTPGYTCACTERYEGVNCSVEKDPCNSIPCQNNGTCTKKSYNEYTCVCTADYTGVNCLTLRKTSGDDDDTTLVIIIAVVIVVVVILIAIILLFCYFKKNSGQQGTYKPNAEEANVGAVAMEEIKKPKVERLI